MQVFQYTGKHMQVQLSTEDMPVSIKLIKSHSLSLKQRLKSVQAVLPSPGFVSWNQQRYLGRRCIAPGTCPTSGIYLTCRKQSFLRRSCEPSPRGSADCQESRTPTFGAPDSRPQCSADRAQLHVYTSTFIVSDQTRMDITLCLSHFRAMNLQPSFRNDHGNYDRNYKIDKQNYGKQIHVPFVQLGCCKTLRFVPSLSVTNL